jgi:hypothetical protein
MCNALKYRGQPISTGPNTSRCTNLVIEWCTFLDPAGASLSYCLFPLRLVTWIRLWTWLEYLCCLIHRLSYLSTNKIIRQTTVQYSALTSNNGILQIPTMAVHFTAIIPTHEMGTDSRLPATTSPPLPGMIPTPPWTGARCRVATVHLKHCLSSEGRLHIMKAKVRSCPCPCLHLGRAAHMPRDSYPPVDQGYRGSVIP